MKWIGQHIWDFISRFRSDVYLEATDSGTIASGGNLGLDSNNKIVKATGVSSVTVTDSSTATNFPIVFHDESNNLLDDTGGLTYNPNLSLLNMYNSVQPTISLYQIGADATDPHINFYNTKADGNGADSDDCGTLGFYAPDASGNANQLYGSIRTSIAEADHTDEAGIMRLKVATEGASQQGLTITGDGASSKVDIGLGYGTASTTTIAGTLTMGSTAFVNNSGVVQVATQGTIDHDSLANFVTAEHVDWAGASAGTIHSSNIPTLNQDTTGEAATVATIAGLAPNTATTQATQPNITSVGTLTNLQVDYINANGSTLTITDSSDTGDLFSIATTTHGATTITTVDDDADAAHLTLDVDGNIILDSHEADGAGGGIMFKNQGTEFARFNTHHSASFMYFWENAGASTDDYFSIGVGEHGATTLTTHDDAAAAADLIFDVDGEVKVNADDFTIESTTSLKPDLTIKATANGTKPSYLNFVKDKGAAGADNDFIGEIGFTSDNDAQEQISFATIVSQVRLAADGAEEGKLSINIKNTNHASLPRESFSLVSNGAVTDVNLGFGPASTTTIAGNLVVTGTPLVGWHGSATKVKILPRDFVANDIGRPLMIEDDSIGSNSIFLHSFGSGDAFAYVPIPTGYQATHVRIYGTDTSQNFYVYEGNIDSRTIVDIATGTTAIGTEKALATPLTSDTTNYIIVRVTSDGSTDEIHGGYVTIASV